MVYFCLVCVVKIQCVSPWLLILWLLSPSVCEPMVDPMVVESIISDTNGWRCLVSNIWFGLVSNNMSCTQQHLIGLTCLVCNIWATIMPAMPCTVLYWFLRCSCLPPAIYLASPHISLSLRMNRQACSIVDLCVAYTFPPVRRQSPMRQSSIRQSSMRTLVLRHSLKQLAQTYNANPTHIHCN
jgi:hypothetical protein